MAIKRTEFEADHSSHFITQIKMPSLIPPLLSRLHGVVRSKIQEGVFLDLTDSSQSTVSHYNASHKHFSALC